MSPPSQSFMSLVLGNVYSLQDMSPISNLNVVEWESSFCLQPNLKTFQPLLIIFSRSWLLHGGQLYYTLYCITYTPHKRACTWIFWRLDEETVLTSEISLLGSSLSDWVTFRLTNLHFTQRLLYDNLHNGESPDKNFSRQLYVLSALCMYMCDI